MSEVYFDCKRGISGNMVIGAFIDYGVPIDVLEDAFRCILDPSRYRIILRKKIINSKSFTYFNTDIEKQQVIREQAVMYLDKIKKSVLPGNVAEISYAILEKLIKAKAKAHQCPVDEVYFQAESLTDTIIDTVGTGACIHHCGVKRVIGSPVLLGSGSFTFNGRTFDVPVPMVKSLLRDTETFKGSDEGEKTTPTGAAILSYLASTYYNEAPDGFYRAGSGLPTEDSSEKQAFHLFFN